jgi:hypothetical protein
LTTLFLLSTPILQEGTNDQLGPIDLAKACDLVFITAEQRGRKVLIPKLYEEILMQISVPLPLGSFIDSTRLPAAPRHRATPCARPHLSKQS